MNTPRWLYAVLAGCAVIIALAASLALLGKSGLLSNNGRYTHVGGSRILDTRTGTVCERSRKVVDGIAYPGVECLAQGGK